MKGKSEIADRLRATLAKELRQDVNTITPQHTLRDDLGLNSLDAIELMFKIEEEFDLSIPDEDMQKLATVGHVIAYIEAKVKNRQEEPPSPSGTRTPPPPAPKSSATLSSGTPVASRRAQPPAKGSPDRKPAPRGKPTRASGKNIKSKGSRRHA